VVTTRFRTFAAELDGEAGLEAMRIFGLADTLNVQRGPVFTSDYSVVGHRDVLLIGWKNLTVIIDNLTALFLHVIADV